jgi:hypothetical protein
MTLFALAFVFAAQTEIAPPVDTPKTEPPVEQTQPQAPPPPLWDDLEREYEMTAEGGIDVCEALSLPLSLVPGIGDAVGTVSEWICLVPAAIAVDYVAVHHGSRDAYLWQAVVALLAQKLFVDLLDTPFYIAVGVAVLAAVGVPAAFAFFLPGTSLLLPTLLVVGGGAALIAPLAWLRDKGGELVFTTLFFALTNQVHGDEAKAARERSVFKPGMAGFARPYVLMAVAAGTKPEREPIELIPVYGTWSKSMRTGELLKERMRRVGKDVLLDKPDRDLTVMDGTIDTLQFIRGAVGAGGQAIAIGGLGVGLTGVILPATGSVDQQTGDTIGFIGLGIAVAGLGIYALSTTADTVRTLAVPCAYGCFE